MKTNEKGLDLIKSFEGCKLESYQDIVGIWTCGYGSTGEDITEGLTWSQEDASDRLLTDLEKFEKQVSEMVSVPLTTNEFSALVSFCYNLGSHHLKTSTLLSKLNEDDRESAAEHFLDWSKAGGVVVPGILRRRKAERNLFLSRD